MQKQRPSNHFADVGKTIKTPKETKVLAYYIPCVTERSYTITN